MKKIERAVSALKALGIESAQALHTTAGADPTMVGISPEDAMKMLLLTEEDTAKLIQFSERVLGSVKTETKNVMGLLTRLVKLSQHSPDLCTKGEHITDSFATGGRRGHVLTRCLACTKTWDGYD